MSNADEAAAAAERLAAGKALFASDWVFRMAVPRIDVLPPVRSVEVAFAGRSNVGKSSLINALVGKRALARTSGTPGRTQELIYFDPVPRDGAPPPIALVDMPGYGYAEAPKALVDAWTSLIIDYLRGRPNLRRVYVLVDSRHGLKPTDFEVMKILDTAAVSYQVVLTKIDKISKGLEAQAVRKLIETTDLALRKHPAAYPQVLATSSEKGWGMDDLRAAIAEVARLG
ncbi:MAG: YihA family ribosome biogenesis GTP-binding protein [Hyphomicrobiaceae bacterium]|nr:YihA family ribosome biogenesis GTP-binding protein [Hyphomicrobiaceae bacterium]